MADTDAFVEGFHAAMSKLDMQWLAGMSADDVSIAPPPFWNKVHGKPAVMAILGAVFSSIDDFRYHRHWRNGSDYVFEFTGSVSGKKLQGVDIMTLNAEGLIQDVAVMIRPINSLLALMETVRARHGALPDS